MKEAGQLCLNCCCHGLGARSFQAVRCCKRSPSHVNVFVNTKLQIARNRGGGHPKVSFCPPKARRKSPAEGHRALAHRTRWYNLCKRTLPKQSEPNLAHPRKPRAPMRIRTLGAGLAIDPPSFLCSKKHTFSKAQKPGSPMLIHTAGRHPKLQ